jgi:hypothetical protein
VADPQGFLKVRERELPTRRPVPVRIKDWHEVYQEQELGQLQRQQALRIHGHARSPADVSISSFWQVYLRRADKGITACKTWKSQQWPDP